MQIRKKASIQFDCLISLMLEVRMHRLNTLQRGKYFPRYDTRDMTLDYIWWTVSSSEDLKSVWYSLIAITHWFTLIWSGSIC